MLPNRFRHFSAISGPLDPSFGPAAALFGHFWPAGPVFWARRSTFRLFLARWTRLLGPPRYFAIVSGPLDPSFGPAAALFGYFWPAGPVFWARRGTFRPFLARWTHLLGPLRHLAAAGQAAGIQQVQFPGSEMPTTVGHRMAPGSAFSAFTVIDLFGFVDGLSEGDGTAVRLYFCRQ